MNHLFSILEQLDRLPDGAEAVLATVISVEGSAYRQPGARMVILPDGQAMGMVSGGCLEKHVVQRAFWLTRQGATVKTYHTASASQSDDGQADEDIDEQIGFGLGCQGSIQVLFERVHTATNTTLLESFKALQQHKQAQALVTVVATNTSEFDIGQHFSLADFQQCISNWQMLSQMPASRKSHCMIETYQNALDEQNQQISVFVETLEPPLQLLIFGAGQDCLPLISMAHLQGWQVTVIDSRLDVIYRQQSTYSANFQHISLEQANQAQRLLISPQPTAVVIMTHSLSQDRVWLTQALTATQPPFYIGQLGPRYRTEQLLDEIRLGLADMPLLPAFDNLFYPVGLPLGGDTPEAVALSITAHIQQVYRQHDHA